MTGLTDDLRASEVPPASADLEIGRLCHSYGSTTILDDVSLKVEAGTIAALLGPSGCGKTTILRAVAGLVQPTSGTIRLGGQDIGFLPTRRRKVGMVFQNYALFPHMTVGENVAYGLQGLGRAERRARVEEMLALVRLDQYGRRLPRELSGGQQQRAAVARALAPRPKLLLLDEPFAALDKDLRLDLQIELVRLQRRFGITTVLVTHDQEEALSIADQVMVMRAGRIEQQGAPTEVYDRPASLFVNLFMGRASTLAATVARPGADGQLALSCGSTFTVAGTLNYREGSDVVLSARPEHIAFCDPADAHAIPATLQVSLPLGPTEIHEVALADGTLLKLSESRATERFRFAKGASVFIRIDPARARIFPASQQSNPSTR